MADTPVALPSNFLWCRGKLEIRISSRRFDTPPDFDICPSPLPRRRYHLAPGAEPEFADMAGTFMLAVRDCGRRGCVCCCWKGEMERLEFFPNGLSPRSEDHSGPGRV